MLSLMFRNLDPYNMARQAKWCACCRVVIHDLLAPSLPCGATGDARPDVLLGDLHYAASQWQDTVRAYLSALTSASQAVSSSTAAVEPRKTKTGSLMGSNMSVVGSSNGVQDVQPWFLPQDTEILGGRLPLSLYLRLATSYLQLGHADYALNAYLQVGAFQKGGFLFCALVDLN
jgi:hypothetical protein